MMAWGLVAALAAVAVIVGIGGKNDGTPTPTPSPGGTMSNKQRLYAQLESLPELTEDQRLFLMLVAYGESGYKPSAHNDSASEVAASSNAYDRIADEFAACGRPRSAYVIGSGGRFQRLVPYFAHDFRELVPCINPALVFDGFHDIISAIANAHALSTRYASWNHKVSGLRGGWGTIAWLDEPPLDKVAKWRKHAVAVGLGADFLDRELTPFPPATSSMLATLFAGAPTS
jgi:hypothetical protein